MSEKNAEIRAAIDAFDVTLARQMIREALPNADAETYYLASKVALDDGQKEEFLEKAVALDPFHENAGNALKLLRNPSSAAPATPPTPAVEAASSLTSVPPLATRESKPIVSPATPVPLTTTPETASVERPKARTLMGISRSLAVLLIVAFFLPWIMASCGNEIVEYSGFDLAKLSVEGITDGGLADADGREIVNVVLFLALAASPILALVVLIFSVTKRHRVARMSVITGIVGLLIIAFNIMNLYLQPSDSEKVSFIEFLTNLLKLMVYGFWVTLIAHIGLLVNGIIFRRKIPKS